MKIVRKIEASGFTIEIERSGPDDIEMLLVGRADRETRVHMVFNLALAREIKSAIDLALNEAP